MKSHILTFAAAFAILALVSSAASAAWVVRHGAPARWYGARRVVVVPAYPLVVPTTVYSTNYVIGPRGHIRHVVPVRTISTPVYVW